MRHDPETAPLVFWSQARLLNVRSRIPFLDWSNVCLSKLDILGNPALKTFWITKNFLKHLKHLPNSAVFVFQFYITLGVGAGSITEFPDGVNTVNGRPKPWSNPSRKALLNFWQDMDAWVATWNQPQMLVDYVKVVALWTRYYAFTITFQFIQLGTFCDY